MTNLGDLNKDGYEDIAIGAPYEGKGTVYIYLGSKNGIKLTPSQVIHFFIILTALFFNLRNFIDYFLNIASTLVILFMQFVVLLLFNRSFTLKICLRRSKHLVIR